MSRIGVSTIGLVGLALGLCAVAGRAADAGTDWDQLQRLHPGDRIRVELRGKPDVTGDFGQSRPTACNWFGVGRNRTIFRGRKSAVYS